MTKFLDYLKDKNIGRYDRDNFDLFLKKTNFSYHIPSIHIAGSNGKGSTAFYLANIYKEAGYKVGLFNSPYFLSPCEMILINGGIINEERFDKYLSDNQKLFDKYDLSEFEIETYIAFKYFEEEKCDIAIIECGMGGEIDATNIFNPILSIITSVSLEHTQYLGRSLSEVALHKAGIIKDGTPVIIPDNLNEDVLSVIRDVAKDTKSKILTSSNYHMARLEDDGYSFIYQDKGELKIATKSIYSLIDAVFALDAIYTLIERYPVDIEAVKRGLLATKLLGRMTVINKKPIIIIDGAHNPEAMKRVSEDLAKSVQNPNIHAVFACFRDKNIELMLSSLNFFANDITLTTFDHKRARNDEDFFLYLEEYRYEEDHKKLIQELINTCPDDIIFVTGSLAFAMLVEKEFENEEYTFENIQSI